MVGLTRCLDGLVLGPHARRFKEIFQLAQQELREVFGMTMVELPLREKVTISQRRGEGIVSIIAPPPLAKKSVSRLIRIPT